MADDGILDVLALTERAERRAKIALLVSIAALVANVALLVIRVLW